jgi:hypothetical protein
MTAAVPAEIARHAPRRWAVLVGVAAVVLAVAVVAVGRPGGSPGALERTRAALEDDHRFANGPTAGTTLADASRWLLDDGDACREDRGDDDPRCAVRLSAAAFTSVAAFAVASCTAPGVYRARRSLLGYLRRIEAFDRRPLGTVAVPSPPPGPTW